MPIHFEKVPQSELPPDKERLYLEVQRFTQVWIISLVVIIILFEGTVFGIGIVKQLIFDEPWGDPPMSDIGLILLTLCVFLFVFLIIGLLFITYLEIRIYPAGIYFRFYPFHWSYRKIPWDTVDEIVGRTYRPIIEYGGWGIRWNFKNWAYTVSGNECIEIRKGNYKVLIGTQRLKELLTALNVAQNRAMRPSQSEEVKDRS